MHRPLNLVLASQSPRRRELLTLAGYPFATLSADIEEIFDPELSMQDNVMQLSLRKAEAALKLVPDPETAIILAADTTVVLDGKPLGKPLDADNAFLMLSNLQGRSHEVLTGFTVLHGETRLTDHALTVVRFDPMPPEEIRRYIDTMRPYDKAGSYGIQDPIMACYVSGIDGCYYNVVGLPVSRVCATLRQLFATASPGTA
ncbi:MAG: septum formation protein Maf [Chlorobiaceae bacterium]|nr:septum formation protein Maf [Chlorobiaceae bacterium]NTW74934.1 septum formation protein Maf [Chlorobiaceae bacterium]